MLKKILNFAYNYYKRFIKIDKFIAITLVFLYIFASLMISSSEMGNNIGSTLVISDALIKQGVIFVFSISAYLVMYSLRIDKKGFKRYYFYSIIMALALLSTRLFPAANGAYAWIRVGGFTIQVSEFAKIFMIVYGGKIFSASNINEKLVIRYLITTLCYTFIIFFIQKDLGSALILALLCYFIMFISDLSSLPKRYRIIVNYLFIFGVIAVIFSFTPYFINLLKNSSSYQAKRFVASANPFEYRYDAGYHLIMSLVSIATGGLWGVGFGKSIHKYMNFPNPSTDFILAVIVEEVGIVVFFIALFLYFLILFKIFLYIKKVKNKQYKIYFFGTIIYVLLHFILNVGGVTGLIPLTGVPLLLFSYGGSSTASFFAAIGLCQNAISCYRLKLDESSSGKI